MKIIISAQNAEIRNLVKLHSSKGRSIEKKFIAEGLRTCQTLKNIGYAPEKIYIIESMLKKVKTIFRDKKITIVNNKVMKKISSSFTPSGVVGVFNIPDEPKYDQLGPGIILVQISDPGNMGTLIRSCAAMGFKSVIIVEGADPWSHKVIQASAGTIAQINLFQWTWQKIMCYKGKLKLIALVSSGGKKPKQVNTKNTLLIIGSESHGIPNEYISDCDEKMTIEMPGKTESLNAAVAGSIAMYLSKTHKFK